MNKTHSVIFSDTGRGIDQAVAEVFDHYGGGRALLKSSGDVYIKVNGVDLRKYAYTDPEVIGAVIRYFQKCGANRVYVIENSTQGNITRLVFKVTGIQKVCKQTGAVPVCLDETGAVPVFLEGLSSFIDLSAFVYERLIAQADQNLYISVPKLKTHSMSGVTLSIKNQFGLVHHQSRIADHNFKLHQKFADIYRLLRPDFVVIDGLIATNHGHYIAEKNAAECIIPMNCLIGGDDPLAVDIIGAAFLGFDAGDVPHIRLSSETGISDADLSNIEIINKDIFDARRKKLTCALLGQFPPELTILRGKTRCCPEGCRLNTETCVEVFYRDYDGKGDFTILMGKDIDPESIRAIQKGPVHIAGSCAIQDYGLEMQRRFGKKNVTFSRGCNNLPETIYALCRHMKVNPIKLSGVNPLTALSVLATAKLKGSRAVIPRLL
jgi:uncharacterized protein (DUF362 family)